MLHHLGFVVVGIIWGFALHRTWLVAKKIWELRKDAPKAKADWQAIEDSLAKQGAAYAEKLGPARFEREPWLCDWRFNPDGDNEWILGTPMAEKWLAHVAEIKRTQVLH